MSLEVASSCACQHIDWNISKEDSKYSVWMFHTWLMVYHLHFIHYLEKFIVTLKDSNHIFISDRSRLLLSKAVDTLSLLAWMFSCKSWAYKWNAQLRFWVRKSINIENNSGERILPCETPARKLHQSEEKSSRRTDCSCPLKYVENNSSYLLKIIR